MFLLLVNDHEMRWFMQTRPIKILIYGHLIETERFLSALKKGEFKPQIDDNCLTVTIDYINYQIWDMRRYVACEKVAETYTNDVEAIINVLEPECEYKGRRHERYQFLNNFEFGMRIYYKDLSPVEECLRDIGQRKFGIDLFLISTLNKKINLLFNSMFNKKSLPSSIMLPFEILKLIVSDLINIEFKNNSKSFSFFISNMNAKQPAINNLKKEEDKKNNAPVENKFNWSGARRFFNTAQASPLLTQPNNSLSKRGKNF